MIQIIGLIIGYFLIGSSYLVAYILVYRPQPQDAQLGLTVLFWPIYVIVEVIVALAFQVGRFGKATAAKINEEKVIS